MVLFFRTFYYIFAVSRNELLYSVVTGWLYIFLWLLGCCIHSKTTKKTNEHAIGTLKACALSVGVLLFVVVLGRTICE